MVTLPEIKLTVHQIALCVRAVNTCTLVIGLVGNVTASIVILSSKSFHTLTGFYLLSLSVADLLILLTGVLATLYLTDSKVVEAGPALFYTAEWICQTSVMVSTLTVTAFTVERYLAICHPFYVQSMTTKSRIKKIIASIWSISALLGLPPALQTLFDVDTNQYIVDVEAVLCFFAPILAITVMYVLIWLKLKKSPKGMKTTSQTDRADTRTLMMFVVIVAVFSLSWGTDHVYRIVNAYIWNTRQTDRFDHEIFRYKFMILMEIRLLIYPLSPALNPIIYSMMSKKFREAFKDLLSKTSQRLVDCSARLYSSSVRSNTV